MKAYTPEDTVLLDDLDFDVPCQHSQHQEKHKDEPASYIVQFTCPLCGQKKPAYAICESGWQRMAPPRWVRHSVRMGGCGAKVRRDPNFKILEYLRRA